MFSWRRGRGVMAQRSAISWSLEGLGRGLGWLSTAGMLIGVVDKAYELRIFQVFVLWLRAEGALLSALSVAIVDAMRPVSEFYVAMARKLFYCFSYDIPQEDKENILFALLLIIYYIFILSFGRRRAINQSVNSASKAGSDRVANGMMWSIVRPFYISLFNPVIIASIILLFLYGREHIDDANLQIFENGVMVAVVGIILLYGAIFSFFDTERRRPCDYFVQIETLILLFGGVLAIAIGIYVMFDCSYCQPLL
jgi:hypothetical protein